MHKKEMRSYIKKNTLKIYNSSNKSTWKFFERFQRYEPTPSRDKLFECGWQGGKV